MPVDWVVVGLDNGGTSNNGTILAFNGQWSIQGTPSTSNSNLSGVASVGTAPGDALPNPPARETIGKEVPRRAGEAEHRHENHTDSQATRHQVTPHELSARVYL